MFKKYLIWGTVALISINLVGCKSVDYVYTDALVKKGLIDETAAKKEKQSKKDDLFYIPKQLGGIKIKDKDAPDGERTFVISRQKKSLVAETKILEGEKKYDDYFDRAYFSATAGQDDYVGMQFRFEDDDKKYFEKAYFNVGADKKKNRVGIELRFIY